jgi:hypothetical protein
VKRLEKRLVEEVNCKAEEFLEYFKKKRPGGKELVRLVGPNYIYFTNGSIIKVYFDGYQEEEVKFINGLIFPFRLPYLRLPGLMRIREDLIRIRETL